MGFRKKYGKINFKKLLVFVIIFIFTNIYSRKHSEFNTLSPEIKESQKIYEEEFTPISEILSNPDKYDGAEVAVVKGECIYIKHKISKSGILILYF